MEQLGLMLPPPRTRARRKDPQTSRAAAEKSSAILLSHYNLILAALATPGTIYDIAARCKVLNHVQVARRMPELHAQKRAEPTDEVKRDGCRVWRKVG